MLQQLQFAVALQRRGSFTPQARTARDMAVTLARRAGVTLAGLVLFVGLVGCTSPPARQATGPLPWAPIPPASSAEALAAGARLAQQHCVCCHTEGATDERVSPVDPTGQAWTGHAWHHPDSVLVQMIAEGINRPTGVMPPFGHVLRPDEVRTLIAFIKTFWTPTEQQFQQERTQRADVAAPPH